MMAAVVEKWEAVSDRDLDRLFSTFLYRIARWTRGEAAPAFTARDIGMFKGIGSADTKAPSARYHLAAQAAVPLFGAWASSAGEPGARNLDRARFQLDAPVPAGRGFFEMVTFMLDELTELRRTAFEGREEFASYRPGEPADDREIFTENSLAPQVQVRHRAVPGSAALLHEQVRRRRSGGRSAETVRLGLHSARGVPASPVPDHRQAGPGNRRALGVRLAPQRRDRPGNP